MKKKCLSVLLVLALLLTSVQPRFIATAEMAEDSSAKTESNVPQKQEDRLPSVKQDELHSLEKKDSSVKESKPDKSLEELPEEQPASDDSDKKADEDPVDDEPADEPADDGIQWSEDGYPLTYRYVDFHINVPTTTRRLLALSTASEEYPSSYSSVTEGRVTTVRNQSPYGTCWAFSATSACESTYGDKTDDYQALSALQLAYFFYHEKIDPLGNASGDQNRITIYDLMSTGGNNLFVMWGLAGWVNGAPESALPYSEENLSKAVSGTLSEEYANQYDIGHVQNVYMIPLGSSGEALNNLKEAVMDYGTISISFYYAANYYNASKGSYYYPGKSANHAVDIVGWNDDYPKENFSSSARPSSNGAWLVRNSWGSDWGTDGDADPTCGTPEGYFWLSYEDASLLYTGYAFVYDCAPATDYTYNYQYDGSCGYNTRTLSFAEKAAAIYSVGGLSNEAELLKAVGLGVATPNVSGTYSIYLNPESNRPESGTLLLTRPFHTTYSGYYTFDIPEDYVPLLNIGDEFSIVFSFNQDTELFVDSTYDGFWCYYAPDLTNDRTYRITGKSISRAATTGYTMRIKGYTVPYSSSVESITLDKETVTLEVGEEETVTLTIDPADANPVIRVTADDSIEVTPVEGSRYTYKIRALNGSKRAATVTFTDGRKDCQAVLIIYVTEYSADGLSYELVEDHYVVTGPGNRTGDITIPYFNEGLPVTAIAANAFSGYQKITSVTIPASVKTIGENAFYNSSLSSVTLSAGVESIEAFAFRNTKLTSVTIPGTVKSLGNLSFGFIPTLVEAKFCNGIEEIGYYSFACNTNLTSILLPDTLTSIGEGAFSSSHSLSGITFPDSLSSIGIHAFSSCSSLKKVTFPASVTFIGCNAFESLALEEAYFDGLPPVALYGFLSDVQIYYYSFITEWLTDKNYNKADGTWYGHALKVRYSEGLEYELDEDSYIITGIGSCADTVLSIPIEHEGLPVSLIGRSAFYGLDQITVLQLHDPNVRLDIGTFSYCSNLTTVYLPEGIREIGDEMFSDCEKLEVINLPDSITRIGAAAFLNCTSLQLEELPASLEEIWNWAFKNANVPPVLTFPSSLLTIRFWAFDETSLIQANFTSDAPTLSDAAFPSDTTIWYPEGAPGYLDSEFYDAGLKTWYGYRICLAGSDGLTYSTIYYYNTFGVQVRSDSTQPAADRFQDGFCRIPEFYRGLPVISIGMNAFFGCTNLTSVEMPDSLLIIDKGAFYNCTGLESVELPESLQYISNYAFYGCTGLREITFPESIWQIKDHAFYHSSLEKAFFLGDAPQSEKYMFPDNTSLYYNPANNTWKIQPSYDPSANTWCGYPLYELSSEGLAFTETAEEVTITGIGTNTDFHLIIPAVIHEKPVVSIADNAFANNSLLLDVTLPESIVSIGANAFGGCSSLRSVRFSGNAPAVSKDSFPYHTVLIIQPSSEGFLDSEDYDRTANTWKEWTLEIAGSGCLNFSENSTSAAVIGLKGECTDTFISIPATYHGKPVISIFSSVFANCTSLKEVFIPDSVQTIYSNVFLNCTSLETVRLSKNLTQISAQVFRNCSSLKEIILPEGLYYIGDYAFTGTAIENVTIPSTVKSYGYYAFSQCAKLKSVTFAEGASVSGTYMFFSCSVLGAVVLPNSFDTLAPGTFLNCKGLTTINLPENLYEIGNQAFTSSGLTDVVIPESVTVFGNAIFTSCASLKHAKLNNNMKDIPSNLFSSCANLEEIEFPNYYYSIGDNAFNGCRKLEEFYVPTTVWKIGVSAFMNCTSMTDIYFSGDAPKCSAASLFTPGTKIHCYSRNAGWTDSPYYDPETETWHGNPLIMFMDIVSDGIEYVDKGDHYAVRSIGECKNDVIILSGTCYGLPVTEIEPNAFANTIDIYRVIIPDSITTIGEGAFDGCENLYSVTFGAELETVGAHAFRGCTHLSHVIFRENVTEIGTGAFDGCASLSYVEFSGNAPAQAEGAFPEGTVITRCFGTEGWAASDRYYFGQQWCGYNLSMKSSLDVQYLLNQKTGYYYVSNGRSILTHPLIIADQIDGIPVDYVLSNAFYGSYTTAIILPDSITDIQYQAFYSCINLKYVQLPEDLMTLGHDAFANCRSLTEISIPDGVTDLPDQLFINCQKLKTVKLPTQLNTIGIRAFLNCGSLETIEIPATLTSIGEGAFSNCLSLTSITFYGDAPEASMTSFPKTATIYCYDASTFIESPLYDKESHTFAGCPLVSLQDDENFLYVYDEDLGGYLVSGFSGDVISASITLPETYLFEPVVGVAEYAFATLTGLYKVTLPDSYLYIGNSAFFSCYDLYDINFPTDLMEIGRQAFAFTALESVILPDGVISLPGGIFYCCSRLHTFVGSEGLLSIGDYAFDGCINLRNLSLPYGLMSIGLGAFWHCNELLEVQIPETVISIRDNAFDTENLVSATFLGAAPKMGANAFPSTVVLHADLSLSGWPKGALNGKNYGDWNGYRIRPLATAGLTYEMIGDRWTVTGIQDCTDTIIVIPEVKSGFIVTQIGEHAFEGLATMTSVLLPDTISSIGADAFNGCVSLSEITIPESVYSIGSEAFAGCTALTAVYFEGAAPAVGSEAFPENAVLYCTFGELGWNAEGAFDRKSMTWNGYPVSFYESEGLLITEYSDYCVVSSVGDCTDSYIVIPASYHGKPVTMLNASAFKRVLTLYGVYIPDSVTTVSDSAFYMCYGLKEVYLSNRLLRIGTYAFSSCTSLPAVELPESLLQIGSDAFLNCHSLTALIVPDSVISIGAYAFSQCELLSEIKLPSGLTVIPDFLFNNDHSLTEIEIPAGVTKIGRWAFGSCANLKEIRLPDGLTEIGEMAFNVCASLTSITIPDGVTALPTQAFSYCYNLAEIILPSGLISIGKYAFYNTSLTRVIIPASVESIGKCAFTGDDVFTEFIFEGAAPSIDPNPFSKGSVVYVNPFLKGWTDSEAYDPVTSTWNGYTLKFSATETGFTYDMYDDHIEITGIEPGYAIPYLVLPSEVNGLPVTKIANGAFFENADLKGIAIPSSVKEIGHSAFADSSISQFILSNGLETIGNAAFSGCTNLLKFDMPDTVLETGKNIFNGCTSLRSVHLSTGLTDVSGYAFYNCRALSEIEFHEGLTIIESNAFRGCRSLSEVTLPTTLLEIGTHAFYTCKNLKTVNFLGCPLYCDDSFDTAVKIYCPNDETAA